MVVSASNSAYRIGQSGSSWYTLFNLTNKCIIKQTEQSILQGTYYTVPLPSQQNRQSMREAKSLMPYHPWWDDNVCFPCRNCITSIFLLHQRSIQASVSIVCCSHNHHRALHPFSKPLGCINIQKLHTCECSPKWQHQCFDALTLEK